MSVFYLIAIDFWMAVIPAPRPAIGGGSANAGPVENGNPIKRLLPGSRIKSGMTNIRDFAYPISAIVNSLTATTTAYKIPTEALQIKKIMAEEDLREGCELCKTLYGMENPRFNDLCSSKKCSALIANDKKKPDYILIFPRYHEMDMAVVKKQKELYAEMEALIRRAKRTLKEKCGAKRFRVEWCNGGPLFRLTGDKNHPLRGVKAHAHCKMEVFYR